MIAPRHADPDLEIENDPRFHRRMRRARRVGELAMLAVTLVAFTGLLGSGPLSRAVIADSSGLRVEHPRFTRADSAYAMRVRLPTGSATEGGYRMELSRQFIDRVRIDAVVPRPIVTEAGTAGRVVYAFAGSAAPVATFHFTPRSIGVVRAELWAPGAPSVAFSMLVYP